MTRMKIHGSVYRRGNGKYQAVAPEVYDPVKGRRRRPGLGTYNTKREAKEALIWFHEDRSNSGTYLTGADLRKRRLGSWLDEWLILIEGQQKSGKLGVRTVSGYRSAEIVRKRCWGRRSIRCCDERKTEGGCSV